MERCETRRTKEGITTKKKIVKIFCEGGKKYASTTRFSEKHHVALQA
jgi:hypothetical protein